MIHEMGLQDRWFNYILHGVKRYELRLFDDKRKKINIGDEILFTSKDGRKMNCKVVSLVRAKNFADLANIIRPVSLCAYKGARYRDLLEIMEAYYPLDKQEQLGVIAIGLAEPQLIDNIF